jgi:hypothetical protein
VNAARHFLQSGTGRGDEADVAAAHDVREAERNAVDDRRAAIGPHDEQLARRGVALDHALVVDADVVREQHHVQSGRERLQRLGGRVIAGHRDQREIGVG